MGNLSVVNPKYFKDKTIPSTKQIEIIVHICPMLHRHCLVTELGVLYSNESFQSVHISTANKLYSHLKQCELDIFPEVSKVLEILLTTPVHSADPERAFSTLERSKSFAINTTSQDRLNALAGLSVHKDIIMDNLFNQKVVDKFVFQRNRRANFMFKEAWGSSLLFNQ